MTLYLGMQVPGDNDQCIDGERQRHLGASSGLPGRVVGDFQGNWEAFRIICLCFKDAGGSSAWSHLFILRKRNGQWSGKQGGHHPISRPCRAHHMDESHLLRGVLMEIMSSGGGWVCLRAGKRYIENRTPQKNKVGQKCGVKRKQSKQNVRADQALEHSSDSTMCKTSSVWEVGLGSMGKSELSLS